LKSSIGRQNGYCGRRLIGKDEDVNTLESFSNKNAASGGSVKDGLILIQEKMKERV